MTPIANVTQFDPKVLLHPGCIESSAKSGEEYLERLAEWFDTDREFFVGFAGAQFLSLAFAEFGYPERRIDLGLPVDSGLVMGQINRLLQRGMSSEQPPLQVIDDPTYLSNDELFEVVCAEVSEASVKGRPFATHCTHWEQPPTTITLTNGEVVEALLDPGDRTSGEVAGRVEGYFGSRTLIIVGGLEDQHFKERLNTLGVKPERLRWVETEKDVSAGIVTQRLRGIRQHDYVVACWTGRIGHDASGVVRDTCSSRDVNLVLGESLSEISRGLVRLALAG